MRSPLLLPTHAARNDLRALAQGGARSRPRAHPHRRRPRRPARPRRDPRRHFRRGGIFAQALRRWRRAARNRAGDCGAAAPRRRDRRRAATRAGRRIAGIPPRRRFCPRRLRSGARRSARVARRIPPRHRRVASALRRDDRHPRAEDPAQQRARLFRRCLGAARRQALERAAQRDLHPSPDHGRAGAFHHAPSSANSKPRSPMPPTARWRSNLRFSTVWPRPWRRPATPIKAAADALATIDVASALATLAVERDYVRPEVDAGLAFAIAGGRHPVVEQALQRAAVRSSPTIATCRRPAGIWLITGPNMAGNRRFCARTR